jgi:cell division septation protein DedD
MLGVGLCALAVYLMGGGPTESVTDGAAPVPAVASAAPVGPGAATDPDDSDPVTESIAPPTPVTPSAATDPGDPDPVAQSIPPTSGPPSDRTSSDDAEDAGAETMLPGTAATTGPGEDTAHAESSTVSDEPKNGSTVDGGLAIGPARPGRFAIQVGAYDRKPQAAALAGRLAAKNYPAYVAESRNLEDRIVFRVRIGGYTDRSTAEATGRRITADEGLDWYLLQTP